MQDFCFTDSTHTADTPVTGASHVRQDCVVSYWVHASWFRGGGCYEHVGRMAVSDCRGGAGTDGIITTEALISDSSCQADTCAPASHWLAGADLVLLRPFFSHNPAFTVMQADGASFENFTDTNFTYDLAMSPRIWLEYRSADDLGVRTQFWQFDQGSNAATTSPPANGFGRVIPPTFDGVDISTTIPTDRFIADSALNAYYIDAEVTKRGSFACWDVVGSAGLRYASVEQRYTAQLRTGPGTLAGLLNLQHRVQGIGPTLAIETRRSLFDGLTLFANGRGSLLFGQSQATFIGGEDLDLATPFHTSYRSSQDSLLPIGEMQLGGEWWSPASSLGQLFVRSALETQFWNGVGNASSENGNLGLIGFSVGVGIVH